MWKEFQTLPDGQQLSLTGGIEVPMNRTVNGRRSGRKQRVSRRASLEQSVNAVGQQRRKRLRITAFFCLRQHIGARSFGLGDHRQDARRIPQRVCEKQNRKYHRRCGCARGVFDPFRHRASHPFCSTAIISFLLFFLLCILSYCRSRRPPLQAASLLK